MSTYKHDFGKDYVRRTKDWTIRHIVATYLSVSEDFLQEYAQLENKSEFSHRLLSKLSDSLYDLKEEIKLIYQPFVVSQNGAKNNDPRFEPTDMEVDFLVNIGLLFHKMVVCREIKYLLDNYNRLSRKYPESADELVLNLGSIFKILSENKTALIRYLKFHSNNITLLAFLLSNTARMKRCVNIQGMELIRRIITVDKLQSMYIEASKYLIESGQFQEARKILRKTKTGGLKNSAVKILLEKAELLEAESL